MILLLSVTCIAIHPNPITMQVSALHSMPICTTGKSFACLCYIHNPGEKDVTSSKHHYDHSTWKFSSRTQSLETWSWKLHLHNHLALWKSSTTYSTQSRGTVSSYAILTVKQYKSPLRRCHWYRNLSGISFLPLLAVFFSVRSCILFSPLLLRLYKWKFETRWSFNHRRV